MTEDADDLLELFFGNDDTGSMQSAYDVVYKVVTDYKEANKDLTHYLARLDNHTAELICTVVDIFNKSPSSRFISDVQACVYGPPVDVKWVEFAWFFERAAKALHSSRLTVDTSEPKECRILIDGYRKEKEREKQKNTSTPRDPRLARVIPGVVRKPPPSTFGGEETPSSSPWASPAPVAAPSAPVSTPTTESAPAAPPKPTSTAPPSGKRTRPLPASEDVLPPLPADIKPNVEELRQAQNALSSKETRQKQSSSSSKASKRASNVEPPSEPKRRATVETPRMSVQNAPSPASSPAPSNPSVHSAPSPAPSNPEMTPDENFIFVTADKDGNTTDYQQYFVYIAMNEVNTDVKTVNPGEVFETMSFLDSAMLHKKPEIMSSAKMWRLTGEENSQEAEDLYESLLAKLDYDITFKQGGDRMVDVFISDCVLQRKRDLFQFEVAMPIDYPYHWSSLITKLEELPKTNRALNRFAICVGYEFAVRFEHCVDIEKEVIDFYNAFFDFYNSTYIENTYTVKQKKGNEDDVYTGEISVSPPKIIIMTVPVIENGNKFPTRHVRALNNRIRKIVAHRKATISSIDFYDWEQETDDITEFNEDNYHTRFFRLFGRLIEKSFFEKTARSIKK